MNRAHRTRWVAVASLLLPAVIYSAAAAAYGGYGTTVDNYCSTQDGSRPFQDMGGTSGGAGCLLCHTSTTGSGAQPGAYDWYNNGQYGQFCTGAPANRAPNGTIAAPTGNRDIQAGGTVVFQGAGVDPDGDAVTFAWDFGVSTATGPGPHSVTYATPGTYVARLSVSDGELADPSPATRTVTVRAADSCTDGDGDGSCAELDCDDGDPAVNPGASEDCTDGIDNNCDGRIDSADPLALGCSACLDSDLDGYSPDGGVCGPLDCDDTDPVTNPGARELCDDRIDNDCDFYLDGTDSECSGEDCIGRLLPGVDPSPMLATDASREQGEPLDGLLVSGSLFVYVADEPSIAQVRFYLDGEPYSTDTQAPWDLAGDTAGVVPFDTRTLANGWHRIRTEVDVTGGGTVSSTATFQVENLAANQAPSCTIDSPAGDTTLAAGASLDFAGTGTDADGDLPLVFAWDFGGAAPASAVQDPGSVRFDRAGTYQVSFRTTDSAGLACAPPATLTLTVEAGTGGGGTFTAHPISESYVVKGHKADWKARPNACRACHGQDFLGTARSATFAPRIWPSAKPQPDGTRLKRYAEGELVGCVECHRAPEYGDPPADDDGDEDDNDSDRDDRDRRGDRDRWRRDD